MKATVPHTKEAMEALFIKSNRRSILFFVVCALWFGFCGYMYFTTTNGAFKTTLTVFFWISIGVWLLINFMQFLVIFLTSSELSTLPDEPIGAFTKADLTDMFDELLRNAPGSEKPAFYISSLSMLNAFAMNTLWNNTRSTNGIYITRKCLEHLSREEVMGILYHEMAHFNKYMYMESRTLSIGMMFFMFLPFGFTALIPGILLKIIFVFVTIFLVLYAFNKIRATHDFESHALEYLCDTKAAEIVGKLTMINALIVLCRENVNLDKDSKKEKIKRTIVDKNPKILVNWAHFDVHIVNGKIEPEEYDRLIQTLEGTENPKLIQDSELDEDSSSHPSLTNRVLFLHRNA